MIKFKFYYIAFLVVLLSTVFAACSEDEPQETMNRPEIFFDSEDDSYKVKVGSTLYLEPQVINNDNAVYRWTLDGNTVSTDIKYTFSSHITGRYHITFEVSNSMYRVDKEIRVDVVPQLPPSITMALPDEGFILVAGAEKIFSPTVSNADSFQWSIDGEPVANTKDLTYRSEYVGDFRIGFIAANEDGSSEIEFSISVRNPEDMPLKWEWEKDIYNMTRGRTIILEPLEVSNSFDAEYTWTVNDDVVQRGNNPQYAFSPATEGEFKLTITAENEFLKTEHKIRVNVFDNEDDNLRKITPLSNADACRVFEFLPAPGQFVNEYYDVRTMQEACAYAEGRFAEQAHVSLGAFGGYVVVGFDHSIINDGEYNIQILGNSFDGSSEPGIVWVMQDENSDGIPNDTWYELKGSEYGKPETIQNYAVTYYKPAGVGMDVAWSDNYGNEGTIDYLTFHRQDSYYPNWVGNNSYTLRGTRLQDRTVDKSGNGSYWYNGNFEWGYADNFSFIDRLTDDSNQNASVNANHLRISNAVDKNGNPADLKYIDFVKIQTGVQAKAGWLGEISTEVFGIRDYNMIKTDN